MRRFEAIVQSNIAPKTSSLWIKDNKLYYFNNGDWKLIGSDTTEIEAIIREVIYNDSNAIDSLKEIEKFLANIDNSESLISLLQDIKNELGADWEAQEGEKGFIENKPFGESIVENVFLRADNLDCTTEIPGRYENCYSVNSSGYIPGLDFDFRTAPAICNIEINGVLYKNVKRQGSSYSAYQYSDGSGSGYPIPTGGTFLIVFSGRTSIYTKEPFTNGTLKIYTEETAVKQLDPKYLPLEEITADEVNSLINPLVAPSTLKARAIGNTQSSEVIERFRTKAKELISKSKLVVKFNNNENND